MKTAKLVCGIISMVLFGVIMFQSCVAGIGGAMMGEGDTSGSGGVMLAICMLIAGIVGVATRSNKKGGIVAGVFYLVGAIAGFANMGIFGDLVIWAVVCVLFAAIFIIGSLKAPKDKDGTPGEPS